MICDSHKSSPSQTGAATGLPVSAPRDYRLVHVLVASLKVPSVAFRLPVADAIAAARDKGMMHEEQIECAIFERNGTIAVIQRK